MDIEDTEACYRAVKSRDRRFDGVFYTGVTSTGIYCRPSCPAITPAKRNVTFHRTAAAAQAAGLPGLQALPARRHARLAGLGRRRRRGRPGDAADRRRRRRARRRRRSRRAGSATPRGTCTGCCPPSSAPGRSPWPGPAARRTPASSSRPRRCRSPTWRSRPGSPASASSTTRSARSTRARPPSSAAGAGTRPPATGPLDLRLPVRAPYAGAELLRFLAAHVVPGVEAAGPDWYARTLAPAARRRPGAARRSPETTRRRATAIVGCQLAVEDLRDVGAAVERCRRLLDADCDPLAVDDALGDDPLMAALVRRRARAAGAGQRRRPRDRDPGRPRPAGLARRGDHAGRQARRAVRRAGAPLDGPVA